MTELSDYIRCVSGPQEESLKRRISELAQSNRRLREVGQELADFAWSAVMADCSEAQIHLNSLVANLRAALKDNGHG